MNQEGGSGGSDIISDAASVTVLEPNKPSTRHEAASFVLPRGITDQEACESTIGQDAGGSQGAGGGVFVCVYLSLFVTYCTSLLTRMAQFDPLRYNRRPQSRVGLRQRCRLSGHLLSRL